jgi:hypothetical protein
MSLYQDYFYTGSIRKYVTVFGTLFNDITVKRIDNTGTVSKEMKVPLSYSPREKFLTRVLQHQEKKAITLPRLSFEMTNMTYQPERKVTTTGKRTGIASSGDKNKSDWMYNPVPYDFEFELNLYVGNTEDGLQVVEQILPFFTPNLNIPVKMVDDIFNEVDDVSLKLESVTKQEEYEGDYLSRKILTWTFNFTMQGYFFKPVVTEGNIIKTAFVNMYPVPTSNPDAQPTDQEIADAQTAGQNTTVKTQPGLTAGGEPTSDPSESVGVDNIDADDNYGFIEEFLDGE